MNKKEIAKALQKARHNSNLTCRELAALLNRGEKAVSAWEHCNGQPDISALIDLRDVYKLASIDEMLGCTLESNFVNTLRVEEKDLISMYRQLTTNSKQIVMTLTQMELNHVDSVKQGETPISILQKSKRETEAAIGIALKRKPIIEREQFIKVFTQSAAAGLGNFVTDVDFEMIAIPSVPHGTEFGVRIKGDSMQPQINDGDIVFVERQPSINVGDIGIFIYDGESYCKQLIYRDNAYYLHSLNNKYKDIPILSDSIYTIGRVLDSYSEDTAQKQDTETFPMIK